jgi:hypothetical protein
MRRARAAGLLVGIAVLAASIRLGWADPGRSVAVLGGQAVSSAAVFAFVATVCWLALALVAGAIVMATLGQTRWSIPRAPLVLLAGAILLVLGVVHQHSAYSVCCATGVTDQQAEQHVR